MILKQSQLEREWPVELTPQQRDQLIQEKYQRMLEWRQSQSQREHDRPNRDHS